MNGIDWSAVIGGVAVIAWINWYFFLATRSPLAVRAAATGGPASGSDGVQEATVTVQGGYQPAAVRVQRGRPVRLRYTARGGGLVGGCLARDGTALGRAGRGAEHPGGRQRGHGC